MDTTATSISSAEMTERVLQTLEQASQPLTIAQIQRHLPRPMQEREDELRQCLQDFVSQGRLHQFAPYRSKTPRFWTRNPEQHARTTILEVLNEQAVTQRELFLKVQRRLQGQPEGWLQQLLSQMLLDGQIRKLPPRPGGHANLLSSREPQPRDYLAPVFHSLFGSLREVFKRLESEGISRERSLQEANALWQAMPWDRMSDEPTDEPGESAEMAEMPMETPNPPPPPEVSDTPVRTGFE